MNPSCCDKKMKRGWEHCPYCGDWIDWETKAQKLVRKKEHERKMKNDPTYRDRHERQAKFLRPMWAHQFKQFMEKPLFLLGDQHPIKYADVAGKLAEINLTNVTRAE